ncbi:MAG: glycine cleavage system protein GcvH [Spirochaetota bacterium]
MAELKIPEGYKYSEKHEWVKVEGDTLFLGITDYAQSNLGDIVFIELPEVDRELEAEESFGTIESVKAVDDLYAPVSGTVVAVNSDLDTEPAKVNEDCYSAWILKLKYDKPEEVDKLMDAGAYGKFVASLD